MIYASVTFFCTTVVAIILLIRRNLELKILQSSNKKYSTVQKAFSSAVQGIQSDLEHEKINSTRYLLILEKIQDGVAIMDKNGILKYANSALWRLYGISPDQISDYMGLSWFELHSPKGQNDIRQKVMPFLERTGVWIGESDVLTKNGILIRAGLYISKTEEGYIGFIRDVSDRFKAKAESERLKRQLQQTQKIDAIERAVHVMVHEFNNTLHSITGLSELLIEDLPLKSETKDYAEKIFHAGQQMQGLLEQAKLLLPKSKNSESHKIDLIELLPSVVGELKKRIPGKFFIESNIKLSYLPITNDHYRMKQVLFHILQNAIEAGGDGAAVDVEIKYFDPRSEKLKEAKEEESYFIKTENDRIEMQYGFFDPELYYAQIIVTDHGSGISLDVIDHVLEPFFSTKPEKAKRGLGMSIVRSVLRSSQGYLIIRSRQGKGTQVIILIPCEMGELKYGFPATTLPDLRSIQGVA